jgi:hypothetical protein
MDFRTEPNRWKEKNHVCTQRNEEEEATIKKHSNILSGKQ